VSQLTTITEPVVKEPLTIEPATIATTSVDLI